MSFIRILVFAALAFVVYNLLRRASLAMRPGNPAAPDERLNRLEPCAHCGVYVDAHEALSRRVGGTPRLYCSDACVQAAEAGTTPEPAPADGRSAPRKGAAHGSDEEHRKDADRDAT